MARFSVSLIVCLFTLACAPVSDSDDGDGVADGDQATGGESTSTAGSSESGAEETTTTQGGSSEETETTGDMDCTPNETDPSSFVIVGFWNGDSTCSGDPIMTNAFPVDGEASCYCWPGNSGQNSADTFACDPGEGSFTYTQYNSLTCGLGDDTPTVKTTYLDQCTQDVPMNLYSKIVDYGACAG